MHPAGSSLTPEAPPSIPDSSNPSAAIPEANVKPPAAGSAALDLPVAGRDWGQEEKGTTEDEMAGWHH